MHSNHLSAMLFFTEKEEAKTLFCFAEDRRCPNLGEADQCTWEENTI